MSRGSMGTCVFNVVDWCLITAYCLVAVKCTCYLWRCLVQWMATIANASSEGSSSVDRSSAVEGKGVGFAPEVCVFTLISSLRPY